MKIKKLLLPILFLILGILLACTGHILSNRVYLPETTETDFPFSVTYRLNGQEQVLSGTYACYLNTDTSGQADPTDRYYSSRYVETGQPGSILLELEEKGGNTLTLYLDLPANYLMGDVADDDASEDPEIAPSLLVYDEAGCVSEDPQALAAFDARLISWSLPTPIENPLRFSHIGRLSFNSIFPMLLGAYLALLACVIFVKKDEGVVLCQADRLSAVFNFLVALLAAPFMALIAALTQIYTDGQELLYQLYFCLPALSVLCVAASLCLRRKGFSRAALIVLFAGPALFLLFTVIEPL